MGEQEQDRRTDAEREDGMKAKQQEQDATVPGSADTASVDADGTAKKDDADRAV